MGCPGCAVTPGTASDVFQRQLLESFGDNMVGILVNPTESPYDADEMRYSVLNIVNRQAVIEVLGSNQFLSGFFDFNAPYQSVFPFGWNAFEPFSDEEWQIVQSLLNDPSFTNEIAAYPEKRGARPFDRSAARTANRAFQQLGYSVSSDDGLLKDSTGGNLNLRFFNVLPHESFGAFEQPFFTGPLRQLGVVVENVPEAVYYNGGFSAVMTTRSGPGPTVVRDFLDIFSMENDPGSKLQIVLSKITELADAYFVGKPVQSVDNVWNEVDAEAAQIHLMVRLLDKVLISESYFLPILYACKAPKADAPCRFPN